MFASHSSCRALSGIPRNLTDDQIRAIAGKGGVVMVNVSSIFLDQKIVDDYVRQKAAVGPKVAEIKKRHAKEPAGSAAADAEIDKLLEGLLSGRADWRTCRSCRRSRRSCSGEGTARTR